MVENPYFQFPLCALAFGETEHNRLNAIIDYSLIENGEKLLGKLTNEQQRRFFSDAKRKGILPQGFDHFEWTHRAAVYAAEIIGVTLGDFLRGIERYHALDAFVKAFEKAHGRDALVRIKKAWLFKARDEHGLSYREFSVLCGLFSAMGDKELAIVTRQRISHCAMGYRTAAIMAVELPRRADKGQPFTERQLRDTISRLHQNRFFARCTVARRITYYSIRLNNEDFRKKVLERRTYPAFFRASQAAQDLALTNTIKRKRRETAQHLPQSPPVTPRFRFAQPGDSS